MAGDFRSVCVFTGSSPGRDPAFAEAASELGAQVARRGMTLVFGGGKVGLMGTVADAALVNGGTVIGVIPKSLQEKELAHPGLTELHVVDSMHARKAKMAELSDGFIAMPGGLGTLEEIFEVLTWAQLGFHTKPCGLLNAVAYYDKLIEFLDQTVSDRFVKSVHRDMIYIHHDPGALLETMDEHKSVMIDKWIDR